MSAIMNQFNASVFITEQMNRMIINAAQELAQRAVNECANKYDFDATEAINFLGLQNIRVERNRPVVEKKSAKEKVVKAAFPLPFTGACIAGCCSALRQNQGLYTQCTGSLKNAVFCKQCQVNADKNGGVPEYGTIAMRQAVGLYDYVDPKGRKPVFYTKIMKKYKVDEAAVNEEAVKMGINIDAEHFIVPEADKKKGRPSSQKDNTAKEKGAKGRPKKAKKMLQIEGDDDDLFASLVADANATTSSTEEPEKKKRGKSDEEKAAEEAKKAEEKAEKEAKRLTEKAELKAKLATEKAEKESKLLLEKIQRELKKAKEEEEKLARKVALEQAKIDKEAKLAAEKDAKKAVKPAAKPTEPEVNEEPDVVKKIEFEGKKYLKSKKTGIVYDYNEYVKNGEQVVIGKYNDSTNKIDFNKASDEEVEEEYDM